MSPLSRGGRNPEPEGGSREGSSAEGGMHDATAADMARLRSELAASELREAALQAELCAQGLCAITVRHRDDFVTVARPVVDALRRSLRPTGEAGRPPDGSPPHALAASAPAGEHALLLAQVNQLQQWRLGVATKLAAVQAKIHVCVRLVITLYYSRDSSFQTLFVATLALQSVLRACALPISRTCV